MGVSLSTLSLTLDVLTPLSQVLACIEWMLETCNVSGIYIYLRDLELCLQITMMSFFGNGDSSAVGVIFLLHGLYIRVMFQAFFVISVKVGGVVWKFLHDPVRRGLCRAQMQQESGFLRSFEDGISRLIGYVCESSCFLYLAASITVLPAFYTDRLSVLMEEGKSYKIPEAESYQI